jgi:hypothetical protein
VDLIQINAEGLQHSRGHALSFANETEQNVLRPHVVMLKADGLFSSHSEDLSDPVGKIVVHNPSGLGGLIVAARFVVARRDFTFGGQDTTNISGSMRVAFLNRKLAAGRLFQVSQLREYHHLVE